MHLQTLAALALSSTIWTAQAQNILLNSSASSSAAHTSVQAAYANDGSLKTAWNASGYAPAWIQFDVPAQHAPIGLIRLTPAQSPAGDTSHTIAVQRSDGKWEDVASIKRYTAELQPIDVTLQPALVNIRKIKVTTTRSPSWVAWYEIEAFAAVRTDTIAATGDRQAPSESGQAKPPAAASAAQASLNGADDDRYLVSRNGRLLYESTSKLVWMRCSLGQVWNGKTCSGAAKTFTFNDAMQAAVSLNQQGGFEGYTDWVVPTIEQLKTLRFCSKGTQNKNIPNSANYNAAEDYCASGSSQPVTSILAMPGTPIGSYKSQSASVNTSFAWALDFKQGVAFDCCSGYRQNAAYVRLLRAGQLPEGQLASNFSTIRVTLAQKAILLASTDWAHDKLEAETNNFIDWGAANGVAYAVQNTATGAPASPPASRLNDCGLDVQALRKFIVSGAAEVWYRHGRADIDELSSINNEKLAWVGSCRDGLAEGEGIVVYYYQGQIERNQTVGAVRAVVTATRGKPTGEVFAYSNTKTCFNTCNVNSYAKLIGRLNNAGASVDVAKKDLETSAQQSNNAMGQLLGSALVKAATVMRAPPGSSAGQASAQGSGSHWAFERTRNVVANGWHAETTLRCTGARNRGDTITILHLNSGRYESVTGPKESSIAKLGDFHCK